MEIKCPKCGSEMKRVYDRKFNHKCFECGTMRNIPFEVLEKQARLDKVLSKMKYHKSEVEYYYYLLETNLSINYVNNKFYLEGQEVHDKVNISLDTVESLIKDLEAQNGLQ